MLSGLLNVVFFKLKVKTDLPIKKESALQRDPREFLAEEANIAKTLGVLRNCQSALCREYRA